MTVAVAAFGFQRRGLRHDDLEDRLLVGHFTRPLSGGEECAFQLASVVRPVIVAVLDGMGGHAAGAEAAAVAMVELSRAEPLPGEPLERFAVRAVTAAERAVERRSAEDPALAGMGTTVAGVVIGPDGMCGFNVGDSRCLQLRLPFLCQLSVDDVPPGAERSGRLTQALGGSGGTVRVHTRTLTLPGPGARGPHRLVLATDGLYEELPIERLESLVARPDVGPLRDACRQLVPTDDATLLVVELSEVATAPPPSECPPSTRPRPEPPPRSVMGRQGARPEEHADERLHERPPGGRRPRRWLGKILAGPGRERRGADADA